MNKVMLIGNVGKEPAVRYLDSNVCVAQIVLATTERGYTLQNGTQVPDRTEWHTVIFWRKQAEIVEKYVHKGDKLYVEGKIQSRDWTDKSGAPHRAVEIMADNLELLSAKPKNANAASAVNVTGGASSAASTAAPVNSSAASSAVATSSTASSDTVTSEVSPKPTAGVVTPSDNNGDYPF